MKRWSVGWKMARNVYNKTGGKCSYCGIDLPPDVHEYDEGGKAVVSIRQWHIDHIHPLSMGGDYSLDNLAPSCKSCNLKKQWISVKCGLSRDPKHRQQMGESVWLFLHMLDRADWDSGKVMEWKDEA